MKMFFISSIALLFVGCASDTKFQGEAHLTKKQCESKCDSWGMQLDGMVAMGEYSDACVCAKKRDLVIREPVVSPVTTPANETVPAVDEGIESDANQDGDSVKNGSGIGAGAIGAILQKRAMDQRNAAAASAASGAMMMNANTF